MGNPIWFALGKKGGDTLPSLRRGAAGSDPPGGFGTEVRGDGTAGNIGDQPMGIGNGTGGGLQDCRDPGFDLGAGISRNFMDQADMVGSLRTE